MGCESVGVYVAPPYATVTQPAVDDSGTVWFAEVRRDPPRTVSPDDSARGNVPRTTTALIACRKDHVPPCIRVDPQTAGSYDAYEAWLRSGRTQPTAGGSSQPE